MSDTVEQLNHDPVTGNFLPGNVWKMPPWRPGQSGHTARYTPNRISTVCIDYIKQQEIADKALTWSGLALFMGLSNKGLHKYRNGEIGKDIAGIVHMLDYMATVIEASKEAMLTDKDYATQGVIFALKNHHGWRDEKHIQLDSKHEQTISIVLDPASNLARSLSDSGSVTIDQVPESKGVER